MGKSTEAVKDLHKRGVVINGVGMVASGLIVDVVEPMLAGMVDAVNLTIAGPARANDIASVVREIARLRSEITRQEERCMLVESVDDLDLCAAKGKAGIILGFQDTLAFEDKIELIDIFHRLGVRIVQLTYQRRNLIGDGCGEAVEGGLSSFGRDVVRELNRVGILIDLSHVSHKTAHDVLDISSLPCAVTHANVMALHQHIRNKMDDLIIHLADKGGVIGISAIARFMAPTEDLGQVTIVDLVKQIDYVSSLVGVEHVGLGLDINEGMTEADVRKRVLGIFSRLPEMQVFPTLETYYVKGLDSMEDFPLITDALLNAGYSDEDVIKILGENFLRVFKTSWRTSER